MNLPKKSTYELTYQLEDIAKDNPKLGDLMSEVVDRLLELE